MKIFAVKKITTISTTVTANASERINSSIVRTFENVTKVEYLEVDSEFVYKITVNVDETTETYNLPVDDYTISIRV